MAIRDAVLASVRRNGARIVAEVETTTGMVSALRLEAGRPCRLRIVMRGRPEILQVAFTGTRRLGLTVAEQYLHDQGVEVLPDNRPFSAIELGA